MWVVSFQVPVTVFVPSTTNPLFIKHMEVENAPVKIEGDVWDETNETAQRFLRKIDSGFVLPFDHPEIWAGHSTWIDQVVTQMKSQPLLLTFLQYF